MEWKMHTSEQIASQFDGVAIWKVDGTPKCFWFKETTDEWALHHGMAYEIAFPNTKVVRFAKVLKTRIYVAVDEAPDGKPVLEMIEAKTHIYH
jgi:hypothetical protein